MNDVVNELVAMVGGSGTFNMKNVSGWRQKHHLNINVDKKAAKKTHELLNKHHELSKSDHVFHNVAEGQKQHAEKPKATVISAAHPIPLDEDDDLKEFNN